MVQGSLVFEADWGQMESLLVSTRAVD